MLRERDQVAILDWDPGQLPEAISALRDRLDQGALEGVLVNLGGEDGVSADGLETLSEACTVCRDRGCAIGMFAAPDDLERLVEVLSLAQHLPPILSGDEEGALRALKGQGGPGAAVLDIELTDVEPALDAETAPTARFDPSRVGDGQQADRDLLAINWADLTQTGYQIGGEDSEQIMAASVGGATTPARQAADEDQVIELDEETRPAVPPRRIFQTEVLKVYDLEADDDLEETRVDEGETAGVFAGAGGGAGDFSPVDTGQEEPPAFLRQDGQPGPAAPPPAPAPQPALPSEVAGLESGDETFMLQAGQLPAGLTSDDETVMFQPDAAEMARILGAAPLAAPVAETPAAPPAGAPTQGGPPTPPPGSTPPRAQPRPRPAPAPVGPSDDPHFQGDGDEQTVMFTPGAFDAALLAEVAAAAGPEARQEPPAVAPLPEPARRVPPQNGQHGELREFASDYALSSPLHLQLLEAFVQSGEDTVGPQDLAKNMQVNDRGALLPLVDQFVQGGLVRRTRSSRIRGGTGFVFSPSPAVRSRVVQLLKLWQGERQTVAGWLSE